MSYWYLYFIPMTGTMVFLLWWWYSSSVRKLTHGYSRFAEAWPRYWVPGVLRQLSLSAATGQPLGPAIEMSLIDMPPGRASRAVRQVRHRIDTGEDLIVAMTDVGLLRSREAAFLQSSLKTRHLDWGLRHLANAMELRRERWVSSLPSLLAPAVILFVGCIVLFIVVAMFMPLLELVIQLS
jgi:type II secretory pathway component PulF